MSDEYIKQLLKKLDYISASISDLGFALFWITVVLVMICIAIWLK